MALMRTGRKMMMGDPPNKTREIPTIPTRRQDVAKALDNLKQVRISGPSDDPFVGTFARKGDIAETSKINKMAQESYSKASSEYKQKSEAKSSYDKQKTAYDKYVSNKPKRKAKGTLEDMTEEQHTAVYGIGTLTGQDRADYLKANPDRARDVLPNENIRIYGYKEAMEQKKKTGKFDPYYEAQAFTDEHIAAGYIPGGIIGKTKRPYTSESTWNDPGADPGSPGKAPEQPKLVQPKTTTVGKIKKDEVESWSSPTRTKGGGSKLITQKIPVKKSTSERQKGYTYGKERKMAAAYYGAVGDVLGEEGRYATSGALGDFQKTRKEDIKGLKQQKKEAISRQDKKDIKEGIKSSRKDIREAKLAQKYVESLPNRYQSMSGVSKGDIRRNVENEKLPEGKNKPKRVVRTFTPEAMKGSTEQARQSMLTETKKVRNLGPTKRTMPKNR
jgi:hypothetical protein